MASMDVRVHLGNTGNFPSEVIAKTCGLKVTHATSC